MDFQAKCYDKIAVVHISQEVSANDIKDLDAAFDLSAARLSSIILVVDLAKIQPTDEPALLAIREKHQRNKRKFFIASKTHANADFKDLCEALDALESPAATRIISLFGKQHKIKVLEQELEKTRAEAAKSLSEALGETLSNTDPATFSRAVYELRDRNKKLNVLYKSLVTNSAAMQKKKIALEKQAAAAPENQSLIAELEKRLLNALKGAI